MTIYQETSNGKIEYWTYSDGQRHFLDARFVSRELKRGAKLIEVC